MDKKERCEGARKILGAVDDILSKDTNIIFDGHQYSIKIPKGFIEELNLDLKKDIIRIELIRPDFHEKENVELKMELIRDAEAKKKKKG